MSPKITAILILKRDDFKLEADNLEKELEAALLSIKAKNYKIRINRLRKLQNEVQELITVDAQAELTELNKVELDYEVKGNSEIMEQNK
jgi:hypothetical protein